MRCGFCIGYTAFNKTLTNFTSSNTTLNDLEANINEMCVSSFSLYRDIEFTCAVMHAW